MAWGKCFELLAKWFTLDLEAIHPSDSQLKEANIEAIYFS